MVIDQILLIDKPKGITSFDVIRRLRKKLEIKKIGHAGTLDPLATGLLIIGVGKGTKKLTEFIKLDKVYETTVLLGRKTTTADQEGEVIEVKTDCNPSPEKINKILEELTGTVSLPVPLYSAIKVGGKKLYKIARKGGGDKITIPKREMEIFWIKLKKPPYKKDDFYLLDLEMKVGSGAYVRSIAEEIGRRLGFPAMVWELRRTRVGGFDVKDAEILPSSRKFQKRF